jgi:3-oxoacyl-[acyl-carrier-protein] synthase-3
MALETASMSIEDIDLIIVATVTPDNTTPSVAAKLSQRFGAKSGTICLDISAACSGFVYALTMVDNMIRLGQIKSALVLGAETLSNIVDWTDRNTCVLFGDGAGAVVVRATTGEGTSADTGVLATKLYADGSHYDNLKILGGVSTTRNAGYVTMDGKEVFKFAVKVIRQGIDAVLEEAGLGMDDIDYVVCHQANKRIIQSVMRHLDGKEEQFYMNIQKYGNTSAASIPIALNELWEEKKVAHGEKILCVSFGAGLTFSAMLITF